MIFEAPADDQGQHVADVTHLPQARASFPLLREMWTERGDHADWDLLSGLHYKMHSLPVGAKFYRLRFRGQTIGVLVIGMSRPLLKERHAVFPKLTPGHDSQISNIHRYAVINDQFRVVGRFVVDTMFRSSGVAYRFLNLVCRMHGFKYAEIMSSMSKFNSFAERAGFTMIKPQKSLHYEKGLKFMRRWFAAHPGDIEAMMDEFHAMSGAMQRKVERELKAFYYGTSPLEKTGSRRHYSEGVVENWDVRRTISKIQGLCFASPLYGFYRNPDCGRALPDMLPLLAFDLQPPGEPLALDRLESVAGWPGLRQTILDQDWRRPTEIGEQRVETHEAKPHDQEQGQRAVLAQGEKQQRDQVQDAAEERHRISL